MRCAAKTARLQPCKNGRKSGATVTRDNKAYELCGPHMDKWTRDPKSVELQEEMGRSTTPAPTQEELLLGKLMNMPGVHRAKDMKEEVDRAVERITRAEELAEGHATRAQLEQRIVGSRLAQIWLNKEESHVELPWYIISLTGHRPPKIGGYNYAAPKRAAVRAALRAKLHMAKDKFGATHRIGVISGGALGVDTDGAAVAHSEGLPFVVAAPCRNQSAPWRDPDKARYDRMRSLASGELAMYLCGDKTIEGGTIFVHNGPYNPRCMQERNEWMVDHCDALLAVWDGSRGGTANCIGYARHERKPISFIEVDKLAF